MRRWSENLKTLSFFYPKLWPLSLFFGLLPVNRSLSESQSYLKSQGHLRSNQVKGYVSILSFLILSFKNQKISKQYLRSYKRSKKILLEKKHLVFQSVPASHVGPSRFRQTIKDLNFTSQYPATGGTTNPFVKKHPISRIGEGCFFRNRNI